MMESLDVDFSKIEMGGDPAPKSPPKKSAAPKRPVGRPSKDSKTKEMADSIEGFLMLIAMPLKLRDIHDYQTGESCADMFVETNDRGAIVLTEQAKELAGAFADVAVDNKFLMKFFDMGDNAGKWLRLAMAVQPFAAGFYFSHFARKVHGNAGADFMGSVGT